MNKRNRLKNNSRRSRKRQRQRGRFRLTSNALPRPSHVPDSELNLTTSDAGNSEPEVILPPQDRAIAPNPNNLDVVETNESNSAEEEIETPLQNQGNIATETTVAEASQSNSDTENNIQDSTENIMPEATSDSANQTAEIDNSEPQTDSYTFKEYECVYDVYNAESNQTPLLLIHPIGVGLSRQFWERFCTQWYASGQTNPIYNTDLLGCGESDAPHLAYYSEDWAAQLEKFVKTVIKKPVVVVVQGALFPVAVELVQIASDSVKAIVASGPPAWGLITKQAPSTQQKLLWNLLFDTPFGSAFYRYARRRQFLESFSTRQLFATEEAVDEEWLEMLKFGSADMKTRYAVFSFLAGFWRKDYGDAIANIQQPALMLFGEGASSISRQGAAETPQERLNAYLDHLPQGEGKLILGRNVMPYEAPETFVAATAEFVNRL
ncbi:MAG: alpha/beta fold hydrolase [Spirulinaceae cyanobacterium]